MIAATLPPPAERPAYTAAEAARYARTSPSTARRWLEGYTYQTRRGLRRAVPVTSHATAQRWLTFYDLVEVAAIASAIRHGVSLSRIRAAIDYARERFQSDRPLLLERFLTDGRSLWMKELAGDDTLHVNASEAGQTAFPYIAEVLRHLDYEDERPVRWYPVGKERPIVVDPRIGFGQPILTPSGVRVETVVDRFAAGEDPADIAADYGIRPQDVLEALRFENRPAVASA